MKRKEKANGQGKRLDNLVEQKVIVEQIKKSEMSAEDQFDFERLIYSSQNLLPCSYEEKLEEVDFTYDICGKKSMVHIWEEDREKQYQLLINFEKLWDLYLHFNYPCTPENIYYDENCQLYVKKRDIYGNGEKPELETFMGNYRAFVCGTFSPKYNIHQMLDSGTGMLQKDKTYREICQLNTPEELAELLRHRKCTYIEKEKLKRKMVSRKGYVIWKMAAILCFLAMSAGITYTIYASQQVIPMQRAVISAENAFIQSDYTACIDSMKEIPVEEMDVSIKYVLAVAYANSENFQKEEIDVIVSRLAPTTNEKELDYWIYLGRLDVKTAEDIALSLSDDKLLIYAYMKETDLLESDTTVSGEEKKARLDQLEQEITKLGEKYKTEETK